MQIHNAHQNLHAPSDQRHVKKERMTRRKHHAIHLHCVHLSDGARFEQGHGDCYWIQFVTDSDGTDTRVWAIGAPT